MSVSEVTGQGAATNNASGKHATHEEGDQTWRFSTERVTWSADREISMAALMDWALEQSRVLVRAARGGAQGAVGFNVALQLVDGSVLLGSFVEWAVRSEEERPLCVAKLSQWVREHGPKYMAVFCDMKGGRPNEAGAKMAVIGASDDAASARIYDLARVKTDGRVVPEREGPGEGIWVDAFQEAMRGRAAGP